jgi:hypothetical protein
MRFESKRAQKKKNEKKTHFTIWKNIFFLQLFFGRFLDFAFQRWIVEFQMAFL